MNAPANNSAPEKTSRKIILSVIEGTLVLAIGFACSTFYWNLSKSTDIRWKYQPAECLNPQVCDISKLSIAVYKLGGEPEKDARLSFALTDARSYQVVGGSVQRSSVGLLSTILGESKEPAHGTRATISTNDSELNESTAFDYTLNEIEEGYRYDLILILKSKTGTFSNYANFQVVDKSHQSIAYEGLSVRNYISLYFAEAFFLTVVLVIIFAILIFGITWKGFKFLAPIGKLIPKRR